jgi:hypothetical protein
MSWVYDMMEQQDEEITFVGNNQEMDQEDFEAHLEDKIQKYIVFKLFGHGEKEEYKGFEDDYWTYVYNIIIEYKTENPDIMTLGEEEEEEISIPSPTCPPQARPLEVS